MKLVLIQKGDIYYFSNPKTNSENEHFESKLAGVEIIMRYILDDVISKCNGLELLEGLIKLRNFPIAPVSKIDQLFCYQSALELISKTQTILRQFSVIETSKDLPIFMICENCHNHGTFIGSDFISCNLDNKKDASECLDELFDKGKINKKEKERLKNEVI